MLIKFNFSYYICFHMSKSTTITIYLHLKHFYRAEAFSPSTNVLNAQSYSCRFSFSDMQQTLEHI